MEALRKAEEAKRRMQQEEQAAVGKDPRETSGAQSASVRPTTPASSAFTLEEREADVTPDYILDNFAGIQDQGDTSGHDAEPVEADPVVTRTAEPEYVRQPTAEPEPGAHVLARRQQRAAAASVFVAKQNPARSRKTLTILALIMVLMIPTGGGILWYLQSTTGPSLGVNPAIANYDLSTRGFLDEGATPTATDAVAGVDVATAATADTESALVEQTETTPDATDADVAVGTTDTEASTPAEVIADEAPATAVAAVAPPVPVAAPVVADAAPATSPLALPETAPTAVLELSRTRATTQINPDLVAAYDRLQAGDLLAAGQLYQEVLGTLPNNRDALLGLALVRLRQDQAGPARELYARALQLNPRDPLAQTGLLQTMQAANPAEQESALKALAAEYPEVAQLTLALGNLYPSQQRWSEAQGAYYNALLTASRSGSGPVHPDYAFNLAVSLEQLNQKKAALEYYRQAQALAAEVTPGFDPQLLISRLAYLEQDQP